MNRKNIKVEKTFLTALKEQFEIDQQRVNAALHQKSWPIRFADLINSFIQDELTQYDQDLYQRVYHRNGGLYPSPKTISRAFIKEEGASPDLLNICGWYLFKEAWKTEQERFDFSEEIKKENHFPNQVTNLDAEEEVKVRIKDTRAKIDNIKAGKNINIDIEGDFKL